MGHEVTAFQLTNRANVACSIGGYPRVVARTKNGAAIPVVLTKVTTTPEGQPVPRTGTVVLPPGGTAQFLENIDYGTTPCDKHEGGQVLFEFNHVDGPLPDPTTPFQAFCDNTPVTVTPLFPAPPTRIPGWPRVSGRPRPTRDRRSGR
jgi:hypothetical protein